MSSIPTERKRVNVVTHADRHYIGDNLQRGDYVRIVPDLEDTCRECDYEIGIDYEMHDYEGRWWWVDRVCAKDAWKLPCGCRVFEIDEWFFSTCMIDAADISKPPEPSWEL